jgi:hypothetical protein
MKRQGMNQALMILNQMKEPHYHEVFIDETESAIQAVWPWRVGGWLQTRGSWRHQGRTRRTSLSHAGVESGWKWWMVCEYKRVRINTRTEL